jgi:hypothetical protein
MHDLDWLKILEISIGVFLGAGLLASIYFLVTFIWVGGNQDERPPQLVFDKLVAGLIFSGLYALCVTLLVTYLWKIELFKLLIALVALGFGSIIFSAAMDAAMFYKKPPLRFFIGVLFLGFFIYMVFGMIFPMAKTISL